MVDMLRQKSTKVLDRLGGENTVVLKKLRGWTC